MDGLSLEPAPMVMAAQSPSRCQQTGVISVTSEVIMNILLETTGMVARSEAQRGSKPKTARLLLQKTCEDCIAAPRSSHIPLVEGIVFSGKSQDMEVKWICRPKSESWLHS